MGRLSAVATVALTLPVVLLVTGLDKQVPAEAKRVAPIKVVHVTKVVRPVTVKRVIERAPSSGAAVVTTASPQQLAPVPAPPRTTEKHAPATGKTVVGRGAPVRRGSAPKPQAETAPQSVEVCEGDACGSSTPPALGSAS